VSESHQSFLSLAEKQRVVTFGKAKPHTWFFVIFWFVAAAMFVYFVCLFEMTGNLVARQEAQPYGGPRLQIFRPLLNAVGDADNFNIMIASARLNPEWIESLLADPNRVERLRSILTFREGPKDFMLHLDSLSERRPGLPMSYSDLVMIDLSAPSWLSEWRREEMYVNGCL